MFDHKHVFSVTFTEEYLEKTVVYCTQHSCPAFKIVYTAQPESD